MTTQVVGLQSWESIEDPVSREFVGKVAAHVAKANTRGQNPDPFWVTGKLGTAEAVRAAVEYFGNRGWRVQMRESGEGDLLLHFS